MLDQEVEALLQRAAHNALEPTPGFVTNWLGVRTSVGLFDNAAHLGGTVRPGLPIPDDGVYGGTTEYWAVVAAVDAAAGSFTMVELGAGWGPWISSAGVLAKRKGITDITLVAVEASAARLDTLKEHVAENGLSEYTRPILGAAWSEDGTIRFPKIGVLDHGGAVSTESADLAKDYRGLQVEMDEVPAYSIPTICQGMDFIDLMHWDIQGAEYEVAASCIDFLTSRVRSVFIGTHSRRVEGGLLELFHAAGWGLVSEKPCAFTYDVAKPTMTGMTTTDGEQYWVNPRL